MGFRFKVLGLCDVLARVRPVYDVIYGPYIHQNGVGIHCSVISLLDYKVLSTTICTQHVVFILLPLLSFMMLVVVKP